MEFTCTIKITKEQLINEPLKMSELKAEQFLKLLNKIGEEQLLYYLGDEALAFEEDCYPDECYDDLISGNNCA
tara:strand:+ start:546 stop:764 length:219 start_codon:yes stop_codon:yes gene_type:complete